MPTPEAVPVRGSESMGPPSLVQTGVSELGTTRGKSVTAGLDREASDADADSSLPKSALKGLGTEPLDSVCPSLLAQSTRQRLQGRVLAPWERYGLTSGFTRIGEHKVASLCNPSTQSSAFHRDDCHRTIRRNTKKLRLVGSGYSSLPLATSPPKKL